MEKNIIIKIYTIAISTATVAFLVYQFSKEMEGKIDTVTMTTSISLGIVLFIVQLLGFSDFGNTKTCKTLQITASLLFVGAIGYLFFPQFSEIFSGVWSVLQSFF